MLRHECLDGTRDDRAVRKRWCGAALRGRRRGGSRGQLPVAVGGERWPRTAIRELAHAVIAGDADDSDDKVPFFAELLAHSVDDATLRSHLHRMVHRRLADAGRQNPKGALIRRLRPLLDDARFERRGRDGYTVAGGPPPATGVFHPDELRAAADGVAITRRTFGPTARRRSPVAADASVADVCEAVLGACPHPLPIDELADVVARRIGMPLDESESSFDAPRPPPEPVAPDAVLAAGARLDAERVWDELDGEERRTIPVLRLDARAAAGRLGVGKTKANAMQRGTLAAIARALGYDPPSDRAELRALLRRDDVRPIMLALDGLTCDRLPYDDSDDDPKDEGAAT